MILSQKCQYVLRATFELAKRSGLGPVKIADIAEVQAIPVRFLEVILGQLKQAGFAVSRRGKQGGYLLARPANEVMVGDIIRFMQGPMGPVRCVAGGSKEECALYGNCAFLPLWKKA